MKLIKRALSFCYLQYVKVKLILSLFLHRNKWDKKSYYPEAKRKNKLIILYDHILHVIKHGEIDEFYFLYGFDRGGGCIIIEVIYTFLIESL